MEIKTENWTFEELQNIMPLLDKYGINSKEEEYIYNLYNRIFKLNRQRGCGKCLRNVIKSLKNRYVELLNKQ